MSSVFKKEKRSRSSVGESNNSFVKNVTSRVSGLLPATITKWFSSPSSSSANGSTPTADVSDSSTEDEATDSPVTVQPPAKRMRFTSSGPKYNESPDIEEINESHPSASVLYNSIQTPSGKNTFRRETNYVSTPYKSTEESVIEKTDKDNFKFHSVTTVSKSVAQKRRSIFELPNRNEDTLKAHDKPTNLTTMKPQKKVCIKPTLLGSPFYPGRTAYGGASSTYINKPNIRHHQTALVNESKDNENVSMSSSARRVMDLLENYSSPLVDARRIPHIPKRSRLDSRNDYSIQNPTRNHYDYKMQELHVPSIASILRLKQRSRLMDTTKVARQIIASHSSTLTSFQPYVTDTSRKETHQSSDDQSQAKLTSKLKSRLTRPNRGEDAFELPEAIQLPDAVLQIDNLPKFNFGETSSSQLGFSFANASKTTFTQTPSLSAFSGPGSFSFPASSTKSTATETKPINEMFKFSSPVKVSLDSQQNDSTPPKFVFGSPESNIDKVVQTEPKTLEFPIISMTNKSSDTTSAKNVSEWKCADCWVSNKANAQKCVCCGAKQPQSKKDGVVAPTSIPKIPVIDVSSPITNKVDSSKWKCEDCWVSNDAKADKCACCGSRKATTASAPAKPAAKPTLDTVSAQWKCEDCWISNKSSVDKCAACGGAKLGTKNNDTVLPPISSQSTLFKSSNKFIEIAKSQKSDDKWECSTCLVTNNSEKTSCACCGTEKNGSDKESSKTLFNFSTNANPTFKFGIDPKVQESNIAKGVEEKSKADAKPIEESETNNNVVPTFTFTLPAKKQEASFKILDDSNIGASKPAFTFGIPKPAATVEPVKPVARSPIKFGDPIKLAAAKDVKDNLQEVPKVDFKLPPITETVTTPNFFVPPPSISKSLSQTTTSTFGSFALKPSENKKEETPNSLLSLTPAEPKSQSEKPQSQNSFTFSSSGIKPGIGMFGIPASTAAPASDIQFGSSLQSTPVTTTAPTMSFFQKPETTSSPGHSMFQKPTAVTSPSVNLFQKSETTNVPLSTTTTPQGSMFSFGSNTQPAASAAASAPEKPKFNFTFGSNATTEGTSLFKPTFSTSDTPTNSFSLSTGNALGGNKLNSNGISTGNVLGGPGNALGGNNDLSNNTIGGSGMQTGNTLSSGSSLFQNIPEDTNTMLSNNTNTNNVFGSSASMNSAQKPLFTFGTSTPFNAGGSAPNPQPTPNLFGNSAQPPQNMFGMSNQNSGSQPSLFPSQPSSNLFGSNQAAPAPAPMGMFGSPPVKAAPPAFGAVNPSIPAFEAPSITPASASTFNFGAPQATNNVFGFGQSPAPQAQQQAMYNFGASAPGATQQLQFNMGSAPNASSTVRRVRKAVRRNTPR